MDLGKHWENIEYKIVPWFRLSALYRTVYAQCSNLVISAEVHVHVYGRFSARPEVDYNFPGMWTISRPNDWRLLMVECEAKQRSIYVIE